MAASGLWLGIRHERNRRKPYLTDNVELGRVFRKKFTRRSSPTGTFGQIETAGRMGQAPRSARTERLAGCHHGIRLERVHRRPTAWPEPAGTCAEISRAVSDGRTDFRIVGSFATRTDESRFGHAARTRAKRNRSRPFPLPGKEFVRRWALHILPKGYTRSRQFGGYHGGKRTTYLTLLPSATGEVAASGAVNSVTEHSPFNAQHRTITTAVSTL